jgi:hypothetical protein
MRTSSQLIGFQSVNTGDRGRGDLRAGLGVCLADLLVMISILSLCRGDPPASCRRPGCGFLGPVPTWWSMDADLQPGAGSAGGECAGGEDTPTAAIVSTCCLFVAACFPARLEAEPGWGETRLLAGLPLSHSTLALPPDRQDRRTQRRDRHRSGNPSEPPVAMLRRLAFEHVARLSSRRICRGTR